MKLGVICDGISRDLEHAVSVMNEFDLTYAELQFVWDYEVGDHSSSDIKRIDQICRDNGKPVSCNENDNHDRLQIPHSTTLPSTIDSIEHQKSR